MALFVRVGDVHQLAVVGQQLGVGLGSVAGEQTDVLHRLIAPQVAHAGGDVANIAEVGAGSGLAFLRDRDAADGFDDRVFVAAVFRRALGAALNRLQGANAAHGTIDRCQNVGQHLLIRQHHGGIGEAAGGIAGGDRMAALLALVRRSGSTARSCRGRRERRARRRWRERHRTSGLRRELLCAPMDSMEIRSPPAAMHRSKERFSFSHNSP